VIIEDITEMAPKWALHLEGKLSLEEELRWRFELDYGERKLNVDEVRNMDQILQPDTTRGFQDEPRPPRCIDSEPPSVLHKLLEQHELQTYLKDLGAYN